MWLCVNKTLFIARSQQRRPNTAKNKINKLKKKKNFIYENRRWVGFDPLVSFPILAPG